jgi:hypothetical protein
LSRKPTAPASNSLAPVHLCLFSRGSLKSAHRHSLCRNALRMEPDFENRVATAKPTSA